MKLLAIVAVCILSNAVFGQTFLGQSKSNILTSHKDCTALDNYAETLVFNCGGLRTIFYFKGADTICDMYATDLNIQNAKDVVQALLNNGFKLTETKYVFPFLVSQKHPAQEKFPAHVYSNGVLDYCIMPISLSGKTAEMNSMVVIYSKKKK
jgi:hypothetical protein